MHISKNIGRKNTIPRRPENEAAEIPRQENPFFAFPEILSGEFSILAIDIRKNISEIF